MLFYRREVRTPGLGLNGIFISLISYNKAVDMAYRDLPPARRAAYEQALRAVTTFTGVQMAMERIGTAEDVAYSLGTLEKPLRAVLSLIEDINVSPADAAAALTSIAGQLRGLSVLQLQPVVARIEMAARFLSEIKT